MIGSDTIQRAANAVKGLENIRAFVNDLHIGTGTYQAELRSLRLLLGEINGELQDTANLCQSRLDRCIDLLEDNK